MTGESQSAENSRSERPATTTYTPKPGDEITYRSVGGSTTATVLEPGSSGPTVETETGLERQIPFHTVQSVESDPRLWVYLASSFSLKDRVQRVHDTLADEAIEVTDVWWDESREHANLKDIDVPDEEWYDLDPVVQRAGRHFRNIRRADAFAIICPRDGTKKFNGANVELGYAIAENIPCFSVGRLERSAMYEPVTQLDSARELADALWSLYTESEHGLLSEYQIEQARQQGSATGQSGGTS